MSGRVMAQKWDDKDGKGGDGGTQGVKEASPSEPRVFLSRSTARTSPLRARQAAVACV